MPASRTGTKRCSPADMSIQFKQCSACQGEVRGGLEAHRFTRLFDRAWILEKKNPGRIFDKTTWHWTSFLRLTGVFWCLVHLNKSRDLSTSATRQLWLCFSGRKRKKKGTTTCCCHVLVCSLILSFHCWSVAKTNSVSLDLPAHQGPPQRQIIHLRDNDKTAAFLSAAHPSPTLLSHLSSVWSGLSLWRVTALTSIGWKAFVPSRSCSERKCRCFWTGTEHLELLPQRPMWVTGTWRRHGEKLIHLHAWIWCKDCRAHC